MAKTETGAAKRDVNRDYEALKDDFGKLRTDIVELMQTMVGAGKEQAGDTRDRMQAEAERRLAQMSDSVERARAAGRARAGEVEEQIVRNPFVSVAIAFVVGMIAGCLWRS